MDDAGLMRALRGVLDEAAAMAASRRPARADRKAHQDHVTDVDLAVDALLQGRLAALTPGLPVLSEERAVTLAGDCPAYWIVDPIDGTANLIAGLPFVGIAAALVDGDGPRVAGVASLGEGRVRLAMRGGGAWACTPDGPPRPLRLPEAPPELVVVSTGLLDRLAGADPARWQALRRVGKIRNLGAQSLHLVGVAEGRFAAVASHEARVWDEAAAGLVVREAGGLWASAADGADWRQPAALMAIAAQQSLACHPGAAQGMAAALAGLVRLPPGADAAATGGDRAG
jgi:fructose-1,6-bisphosphatase/inositol monophosphatase family enzyme